MFVLTGSGLDSDCKDGTEDRNDLTHTESIARHYSALSGLLQPSLGIYRGRAGGGHYLHTRVKTPIPGQTLELTLFSRGNNNIKNNPTQILPEGAVLGF